MSTIAHEAEVHFHLQAQNGIWWNDPQGIAMMEVQAYNYELANANRFGLTSDDIADITSSRNKYWGQLTLPNRLLVSQGNYTIHWLLGWL